MKGRALRRALATNDAHRVSGDIPPIRDTTELVTPDDAYKLLERNRNNRPINWRKVEEYAAIMARGDWQLHAQGVILDTDDNILTGQKRLWAIIYSGASVWMRISRGSPPATSRLIDRHEPQSARDLATRGSGRKHRPTESSIARGVLALGGVLRPSTDQLAACIQGNSGTVEALLAATSGTKKTRAVIMVIAASVAACRQPRIVPHAPADVQAHAGTAADDRERSRVECVAKDIAQLAERLETRLLPQTAESCWGRGAAFSMAMAGALALVREALADVRP